MIRLSTYRYSTSELSYSVALGFSSVSYCYIDSDSDTLQVSATPDILNGTDSSADIWLSWDVVGNDRVVRFGRGSVFDADVVAECQHAGPFYDVNFLSVASDAETDWSIIY